MNAVPPPIAPISPRPAVRRTRFRGCLTAALISAVVLPLLVLGAIWWLAHLYEKGPKKPGEAEYMDVVYKQLTVYSGKEGMGNSAEAEQMAREFARKLRAGRHMFFTEGSRSLLSLTDGHFLTFCSETSNRCAFVVHVPQLRYYTPEAKTSIGELAWVLATEQVLLTSTNRNIEKLALGIRGALGMHQILLGPVNASHKPLDNLQEKKPGHEEEALYPFFDWPRENAAGQRAAAAGSEALPAGDLLARSR